MKNGPFAVVGASVLWGTAGTAGLLVSADSIALAAARLVIGGAALALFAWTGARRGPLITPWQLSRNWPRSELVVIDQAGHDARDPRMSEAIVAATDRFAGG